MLSTLKKQKPVDYFKEALEAKKKKDYQNFVALLKEGHENNNEDCTYHYGECFNYGFYGLKKDSEEAIRIFSKNTNHMKSLVRVAELSFFSAILVERYDRDKIYRRIMNSENNFYAKGICCCYSWGGDNLEAGFKYFLKASEEGDDDGTHGVAIFFKHGYVVKQDVKKAYEILQQLVNIGYTRAIKDICDIHHRKLLGTTVTYEYCLNLYKECYIQCGKGDYLAYELYDKDKMNESLFDNIESLVNLHLARCYLGIRSFSVIPRYFQLNNTDGKNIESDFIQRKYLAWYFYRRTNDPDGVKEFQEYERTCLKRFARCRKITLTLLCIAKFFPRSLGIPGDILKMMSMYVWKTKLDEEWNY